VPERLPGGSAVDLRGLDQIVGHGLQSGDVDDHHIADLLPAHQYNQTPIAVFRAQLDAHGQDAVEDHFPDIAQNDAADQVRHEEHAAEQVAALDAAREHIRHRKGQKIN